MALRFPVLFVGFVSFSSLRISVVIVTHYATPLRGRLLIGVSFLRGLSFTDHRLLFRLRHLLLFDAYGLGIAQERDPEEGRTVTNLGRSPADH